MSVIASHRSTARITLPLKFYCQRSRKFILRHSHSTLKFLVSVLAVCKGLATNRFQEIYSKVSACASRRYPKSYGVLYNKPCDGNHRDCSTEMDGNCYVRGQVYWFIKEDEEYGNGNAMYRFFRLAKPGEARQTWTDKIVESTNDTKGYRVLCNVKTSLGDVTLDPSIDGVDKGNRYWYGWGNWGSFLQVNYNIRPIITRTEVKFEVWFNHQVKGSYRDVLYPLNDRSDSDTTGGEWDDLPMREESSKKKNWFFIF